MLQCKSIGCMNLVQPNQDYCPTCLSLHRIRVQALDRASTDKPLEPVSFPIPPAPSEEFSGGKVNYYTIPITDPMHGTPPYNATCQDIIEALGMTFNEGNAFKSLWRMAAARKGLKKKGDDGGLYNAQKVQFAGDRIVIEEERRLAAITS